MSIRLALFASTAMLAGLMPLCAQNQTSITVKTMRIVNGDTVWTEKTIQGNGDFHENDTLRSSDPSFLFFRREYSLDTSFSEDFEKMFSDEINQFLRSFNTMDQTWNLPGFERYFFADTLFKSFTDSSAMIDYLLRLLPDTMQFPVNEQPMVRPPAKLMARQIISSFGREVEGFGVEPESPDRMINVWFMLSPERKTLLEIEGCGKKSCYSERLPKADMQYNRRFDLGFLKPGTYYIKVSQGRKVHSIAEVKVLY